MSKAAKKNAKRKQKRLEAAPMAGQSEEPTAVAAARGRPSDAPADEGHGAGDKGGTGGEGDKGEEGGAAADGERRLRNLRKLLRQISDLERRIASGDLAAPAADQLEKVERRGGVAAEIDALVGQLVL